MTKVRASYREKITHSNSIIQTTTSSITPTNSKTKSNIIVSTLKDAKNKTKAMINSLICMGSDLISIKKIVMTEQSSIKWIIMIEQLSLRG